MKNWSISKSVTKQEILNYLNHDRYYAAYAIGDLEPFFYQKSTWHVARHENRVESLTLLYNGLDPPALFLIGNLGGLRAILNNIECPSQVYFTCLPEQLIITREFYYWEELIPMWRMVLDRKNLCGPPVDCIRLSNEHNEQVSNLIAGGDISGFNIYQVGQGIFYGIFSQGKLVAMSGTHIVSQTNNIAAIGNVFTHQDYRGLGYASRTTSAVVNELLGIGITDIVLNVSKVNIPAIKIYEKLGFTKYCEFIEGKAYHIQQ